MCTQIKQKNLEKTSARQNNKASDTLYRSRLTLHNLLHDNAINPTQPQNTTYYISKA
jgi:hypothetical protein